MIEGLLIGVQLFFSAVVGIYFLTQLKQNKANKTTVFKDSGEKLEQLQRLRRLSLTEPLSEKLRPKSDADIIGQEDGMLALKTALCTPNPQHILIYGSPGIGKTAAARVVLEMAKKSEKSPFNNFSKFVEIDATTLRFDERSVADPLMGSVHDPIYQGAGAYGQAGIPQPKEGAVTKAHGGILFIDEIGELHPTQMNKLLKVLEDRKVFLESAYYGKQDDRIPAYIHDIFQKGLPADFRLIGATTRSRDEIPPALRSRCIEIFFKDLTQPDIEQIITSVTDREHMVLEEGCQKLISQYANNGRDAVNILQTAYNKAKLESHDSISVKDTEWVLQTGGYHMQPYKELEARYHIGKVNGLGVYGHGQGTVLEVQAIAQKVAKGEGELKVTGVIEEEELRGRNSVSKRKSMAHSSAQNVLTLIKTKYHVDTDSYYIHINFPTGIPVDGPSAGVAMFSAVYSAIFEEPILQTLAMTGEVTIHGEVYPVGGVKEKLLGAKQAGATKAIIPKANAQKYFDDIDLEVISVENIDELIQEVFGGSIMKKAEDILHA
ncbi:MAG: ATP-dependent protease LonB [Cellulosilyticaceae bacterium]